jgi:serine/threonine protein kinase
VADINDLRDDTNSRIIGDYILLKALGGENGHVQLAVHKTTHNKVAVKSLKKEQMNKEELERARREIKIMEKLTELDNPYIIKLIEWHETSTHFNLIVEYVSGGELVSLIKSKGGLPEPQAKKLFKQMLCALSCCHQQNIIHRDLKLQNILLDSQENIKLIDFGLSNFVETGVFRNTFCGTPAFAPPEILLGTEYKGPEVDLWSLGVVLYSMVTAEFPFKTVGEILKGKFTDPSNVSSECVDLLRKLLVVKKEDRFSVEDVAKHNWVTQCDDNVQMGSSDNVAEPDLKRRRSY